MHDGARIGAVRGAARQQRTPPGVICAKVARYAERVHHPDRLTRPLLRTGPKGAGQFREIGWDEALDRVAGAFTETAARHGAGSGLAVLLRRHDGPGAARRHQPAAPRDALLPPAQHDLLVDHRERLDRRRRPLRRPGSARDGRGRPDRDVGRQPGLHPGQRDDPRDPRPQAARRQASWSSTPTARHRRRRRPASGAAARHRRRAGLRRDARRLPRRLRRPRLHGALHRRAGRARGASGRARPGLGVRDHRPLGRGRDRGLRPRSTASTERAFIRVGYGFARSRNGAGNMHAVTCLPTVTGKWRHRGRRRVLEQPRQRHLPSRTRR